ncbi:hypothetical protein PRIPAC_77673 [Pristionchus pacificus]|uniref:Uncharacterized protein n=1 Tax=Pristionchus pacificus TaxID=54126 RepID=A0A2A6CQJ6_PRIPA|nr:hypothetical protein PRIPAC_77673 [Pristionchus pacificus]|eukprot:PDM80358.1 hypothetical protein PRIPAC_32937 [Pristionchus pacificus]
MTKQIQSQYNTHLIMSIEIIIVNIVTTVVYAIAGRSLGKMTRRTVFAPQLINTTIRKHMLLSFGFRKNKG